MPKISDKTCPSRFLEFGSLATMNLWLKLENSAAIHSLTTLARPGGSKFGNQKSRLFRFPVLLLLSTLACPSGSKFGN